MLHVLFNDCSCRSLYCLYNWKVNPDFDNVVFLLPANFPKDFCFDVF